MRPGRSRSKSQLISAVKVMGREQLKIRAERRRWWARLIVASLLSYLLGAATFLRFLPQ